MYPLALGQIFMIMHTCTGTGGFDGVTEEQRASVIIPGVSSPNGDVVIRARLLGTQGNAYTVGFIDMGAGITVTTTSVIQVGTSILVTLRRSPSAVLATASEVAAAINAVTSFGFPISADARTSTPTVCKGVSATPLTGGVDANIIDPSGTQFISSFSNLNSGVFTFENFSEVVHIRQLQFTFALSSPATLGVYLANLTPGLGLVAGSDGPIIEVAMTAAPGNDFGITDVRIPVLPYQACLVQCLTSAPAAQPGVVKIWAERLGPNLIQ